MYAAAHGGFGGQAIPLGGGAAVSQLLLEEWSRTAPFAVRLLGPAILGGQAPSGRQLVAFDEVRYAAFCQQFRQAVTEEILREDPARTAVLVNDISEGPDFARLHAAGFPIVTIYHVDVVAYIAAIYLKNVLAPATLTRFWEGLRRWKLDGPAPAILKLIFAQQRASLVYSRAVVVPSAGMKKVLLECYPETPADRIHVLPWGAPPLAGRPDEGLRAEFGVPDEAAVLLCLSRISPEKGQDTLLEALREWEESGEFPQRPVWLFICGEAAFMHGRRHLERLRRLAGRLRRVRVVFPGYASGGRKLGFFAMSDLYVFPSRHESYGLTLMEALSSGLPAVCLEHQGSREVMQPSCGVMISGQDRRGVRTALWHEIAALLADRERLAGMRTAARGLAASQPFSRAAAELAELLVD
jgi:glycosyltransferase involved in cell wall biosynthesis